MSIKVTKRRLREAEMAEELSIKPRTLRKWRSLRTVPWEQVGHVILFDPDAVFAVNHDSPLAAGCEKPPDKEGKNTIGEFRAEGGQSVIRGVHPSGCYYRWLVRNPPITIAFEEIRWPADIATTPSARDSAEILLAKIRKDFRELSQKGTIFLRRNDITCKYAPHSGRMGAWTPNDIFF